MTAKIITITNAKGGVGKTTVSMHLAVALHRRGAKVLVVDGDPTGAATEWATVREEDFPTNIVGLAAAGAQIHRELAKLAGDYTHIIVDCPQAAYSNVPRSAMLVSDLAIVPAIPSPVDLRASKQIREIIDQVTTTNEELIARVLLNAVNKNTVLFRQSLAILPEFGIEVMKARLSQREIFRQIAAFGRTVYDEARRNTAAVEEVEIFANEVVQLLKQPKLVVKDLRAATA
jgi:chromosome partitioning protein